MTVPVGVVGPLRAMSVTVAVHDVAWPMTTVSGEQMICMDSKLAAS